ncbi:MAG: transporter substrate-binding protein [Acidimicrobiales bacterium]|nr:transporter substrate-binding protein [Acidimicrobiales bacterium]
MRPVGRRWGAALVSLAALASLLSGCGDKAGTEHTIGILRAVPAKDREQAFFAALDQAGYDRSQLRVLGGKATEVHPDKDDAEQTAKAWVADGVELIVALSTTSAQAARAATSTVPILVLVNDPSGSGLVTDERRPTGNVTGSSYRVPSDRLLAVADDAFGDVHDVGCLYPSDDPGARPPHADLVRGARALDMTLRCASFASPVGVAGAVAELVADGVDVIYLVNASGTVRAFPELERALVGVPVPVLASTPTDFATLLLEPDGKDLYRQLGRQAARLLDGAKVSEVPVQDPGRFLLVVNLAAARRVGATIPTEILDRADQLIR